MDLYLPSLDLSDADRDALREQLAAALLADAGAVLPDHNIEIQYDEEVAHFSIYEFVTVTADNLAAARAFGELELGEELGFDLAAPSPDYTAFGIDLDAWARLRVRAEQTFAAIVAELRFARALAAFETWLAPRREGLAGWRRAAWLPVVEPGLAAPDSLSGKTYYGGPAWLRADDPWPACTACGAAMELLLHLDLAGTPLAVGVSGIYELFACDRCNGVELARAVHPDATPRPSPIADPRCRPQTVVGWRPIDDYSTYASDEPEYEALGVMALAGDKLGGWPRRVQGTREQAATCPECQGDTIHIYQLDSDMCSLPIPHRHGVAHSRWMWGDLGRAWLEVCPQHPNHPVFWWECS